MFKEDKIVELVSNTFHEILKLVGGTPPVTGVAKEYNGHTLYQNGDPNLPYQIVDGNNQVVLSQCKVCGKGESELDEPCAPPVQQTQKGFPPLQRYKQTWDSTSSLIARDDGDYYKVSEVDSLFASFVEPVPGNDQKEIVWLKFELAQTKEAYDEMVTRCQSLLNERDGLTVAVSRVQHESAQMNKANEKLQASLHMVSENRDHFRDAYERMKTNRDALHQEHSKLQEQLIVAHSDIETYAKSLKDKIAESEFHQNEKIESRAENNNLRNVIDALGSKIDVIKAIANKP